MSGALDGSGIGDEGGPTWTVALSAVAPEPHVIT